MIAEKRVTFYTIHDFSLKSVLFAFFLIKKINFIVIHL